LLMYNYWGLVQIYMVSRRYIYFFRKSKEQEQVEALKPYLKIILKRKVKKIRCVKDVWN